MTGVALGIFLVLHAAVYLLYFGQSVRLIELKPGMRWPDDAWGFGAVASSTPARVTAAVVCVAGAAGFAAGGVALLAAQPWWREVVLVTAAVAVFGFLFLWDRTARDLPGQGAVGVAIDGVLAAAALLAPSFGLAA